MDISIRRLGKAAWDFLQGSLTGAQWVSDRHAKFQESTLSGRVFSSGMSLTSISNATFTTATLGATCTPICGVWNPLTNTRNAVVLKAKLQAILTALQATGAGTYQWVVSYGNGSISTGSAPMNRLTLQTSGSQMKGLAGIALTGLTNNLVVIGASGLQGGSAYNASLLSTAAGFQTPPQASVDYIEGEFIVPPGGILALLCSTTPVAVSAGSDLVWEEIDLV